MMKQMSYDEALVRAGEFIIAGENVNSIKAKNNNKLKMVKFQTPLPFERINEIIHSHYDGLEYIKFWEGVKIYRVSKGIY